MVLPQDGYGVLNSAPIAAFFREYDKRIASAVGANLARGMAGKNVIGAIADATPRLKDPADWKQGIRGYYPRAASLRGLNVRDNWLFTIRRFNENDPSSDNAFLIGSLYNPHPGGQMLIYGQQKKDWLISPQYASPELGRVPKRLRFLGKRGTEYNAIVMRRESVPANVAFRDKVIGIIQKRNREDAEAAFLAAQQTVNKVLGFGPKNQMYLRWYYTDKQIARMRADAEASG